VPGSVAPSQTGFSSPPIRGQGSLAFNTSGNREETVGFLVNGVAITNLTFGSLGYQPSISSIREFRVENSAFGAEHGHVSGSVVSIVTRSGSDRFHGQVFGALRDDALDARNFFELASAPSPFERQQFGATLGGPYARGSGYFFAAYEGLRQRQGLDVNSLVLSDEQRASAIDPVVRRLLDVIPRANVVDAAGTPRFVGSAAAVANTDRWSVDIQHTLGRRDRVQLFYGSQRVRSLEPGSSGTSIPGFGITREPTGDILTIGETRVFGSRLLNEVRFGRSTLDGTIYPAAELNPATFGIRNGVDEPIGLPQIVVAGGLNFGGPANFPQGRTDVSYELSDTLSYARGAHSLKLGGTYRHFVNENVAQGTGLFNFPTVESFLSGTANAFSITLGSRRNVIDQRAAALFVQDAIALGTRVIVTLGLRYEWHVTPTERDDQFVTFDVGSVSLVRVGVDRERIYGQNNRNVEPRVGAVWDLSGDGLTVLRAAYALAVDQPGTFVVKDTASNPPFAVPLSASGAIGFLNALDASRPVGLAPITVDSAFTNASLQAWNVNLQRQLAWNVGLTIGYFGSRGRDLTIARNINQPVAGARPYTALSASSPIAPGEPLGNITQVESSGFSSYRALWVSAAKRLSQDFQMDASYTWSRSLDTNSLGSRGYAIQDSYDIASQYGPSDFDAPHRFVLSGTYVLPFDGHPLSRGWRVAAIVQAQAGNPVNIVTGDSALNGTANTVRPDLVGPIRVIGSVDRWFDPSVFVAVNRFGNLSRNAVVGPGFKNTDLAIVRDVTLPGRCRVILRLDVFNLFNHANLGPPGNIVGTPTFGRITRTRLPTGEAGSSRQMQFGITVSY
jgi:hypothetical protein